MTRPMHVYCQQMTSPGVWCPRKAVAPDPRNPATSSLCKSHLASAREGCQPAPFDIEGQGDNGGRGA